LVARAGFLWSRDAGRTFQDLAPGFPLSPREIRAPRIALDGGLSYDVTAALIGERTLLVGGVHGLFRYDFGQSWVKVPLPNDVQSIVALSNDAGRVYIATPNALFVSDEHAHAFRKLEVALPPRSSLAGMSAASGELMVIAKNYEVLPPDGVAITLSTDGGSSWQLQSKGLDAFPASQPVRGQRGWYVGLESNGVWFLPRK